MDFARLWAVNLGLQKRLQNDATLTVTVNDVFDSLEWWWTSGSPSDPLYTLQLLDFNQRTVTATCSTRFGSGKAAGARSTASDEERQRMQ